MATKITITPMLDEEDGTPVFEVRDESGNATNFTNMKDALECIERWTVPVQSLESMARNWIIGHGSNITDDIREDVEAEFEMHFTNDQFDSFCNMLAYSKITVEFPYGYGVPSTPDYCPETENHRHQITDGSCDQCGEKNF
jgi:hypothetical protein